MAFRVGTPGLLAAEVWLHAWMHTVGIRSRSWVHTLSYSAGEGRRNLGLLEYKVKIYSGSCPKFNEAFVGNLLDFVFAKGPCIRRAQSSRTPITHASARTTAGCASARSRCLDPTARFALPGFFCPNPSACTSLHRFLCLDLVLKLGCLEPSAHIPLPEPRCQNPAVGSFCLDPAAWIHLTGSGCPDPSTWTPLLGSFCLSPAKRISREPGGSSRGRQRACLLNRTVWSMTSDQEFVLARNAVYPLSSFGMVCCCKPVLRTSTRGAQGGLLLQTSTAYFH
ncbi:hypothetical protein ACRRTK_008914 [Alexandromys fortis]